ncbi:hypothetical protein FSP39_009027 [Pinctada imbricata]|uniref:Uncharacterized protein n=1 Tax=Pinctada imbricata TaxID=66713 RepID=A0AA88XZ91_PINIB|nr:hypothetical protein FSP39_009027 [Pinctada imbricata]
MASITRSSASSSHHGHKRKRANSEDHSYNSQIDDPDSDTTSLSASRWIREDLEALGVFYDKEPVSLGVLEDKLKQILPRVVVPLFLSHFKTLLKEQLLFDLDMARLDDPAYVTTGLVKHYVEEMSPKLDKEIQQLSLVLSETFEDQLRLAEIRDQDKKLFKVMFMKWCYTYAPDFIQECLNLLDAFADARWQENEVDGKYVRTISEEKFTGVVRAFTRIFFLDPIVPAGPHCKRIRIKGKIVNSEPDLTFCEYDINGKSSGTMVMFFEVKRCSILKPTEEARDVWIGNRVSRDVLGQVGAELLSEVGNSIFYPHVLGVLCMRTEIIFVLLEMKPDHAVRVFGDGDVTGDHSIIYYSEAFDIVKAEDRVKVCDLLLMLASCQKPNFHWHYTRQ